MNDRGAVDYIVTAVGYNEKRTHINVVEIREHILYVAWGNPEVYKRSQVVNLIHQKKKVVTATKPKTAEQWKRGADIDIVVVNDVEYLRTDRNNREADNLGELPEL